MSDEAGRSAPPRLAAERPWPGLDAFDEAGADFFHGRVAETDALVRCVEDAPLTVLFGRSGLGKTSLLKAGLFPRLRQRGYLPTLVRLDISANAPAFAEQIASALSAEIAEREVDAPARVAGESLWETLHRSDFELWSSRNYPLTPVLVIDQFEELFTLGRSAPEMVDRFRPALGDLAENRIPEDLARRLQDDPGAAEDLDLRSRRYKLLISLREDFLAELEDWCSVIPALMRMRYRLLPMSTEQAFDAVFGSAAHLMDESIARRIVSFVAAEHQAQSASKVDLQVPDTTGVGEPGAAIEPALLSLFCRGLNERRLRARAARFDATLLDSAKQGIIADYYESCVADLPELACRFIENELITEKGYRNNFAREDAVPSILAAEQLESLISRRLLRTETRFGVQRIELTHDLLTRVVREHRDLRRAEDEKAAIARRAEAARQAEEFLRLQAEARAGRRFRVLAGALALSLAGAVWQGWTAMTQREVAVNEAAKAARAQAQEASQRALAEHRLTRIVDGLRLKQAVLAEDAARITQYLDSRLAETRLQFGASARYLNYSNPSGQKVYEFSLFPEMGTLPPEHAAVGLVTYWMNHPTFKNSLMTAGPQQSFTARYIGWGCLHTVIALIEYVDPDKAPQITKFDMCERLRTEGPGAPGKGDQPGFG
ncbi:MAG: hypothetical protein H6948_05305 [Zoogloeaceae bacterium]|nr:hypothetical protein [Zoogloeaceae bacterium]